MQKFLFKATWIAAATVALASSAFAGGGRDCQIINGQRVCSGGGSGPLPPQRPPTHNPPPQRPPVYNPPPQRPPVYNPPPQRPPTHNPPPNYYPPSQPPYNPYPPVYNPRPPVYNPPTYYPPSNPSWSLYQAQNLTSNLEIAISNTRNSAEIESRWNSNSNQLNALLKLQRLQDSVRRLRQQLSAYHQSPTYTSYEYRSLKSDFEDVRQSLYWAHFSSRVDYDFDQVERFILQLDQIYWGY